MPKIPSAIQGWRMRLSTKQWCSQKNHMPRDTSRAETFTYLFTVVPAANLQAPPPVTSMASACELVLISQHCPLQLDKMVPDPVLLRLRLRHRLKENIFLAEQYNKHYILVLGMAVNVLLVQGLLGN